MSWTNFTRSSRKLFVFGTIAATLVVALCFIVLETPVEAVSAGSAAPAATFPGTGTGAIPDGVTCGVEGAARTISFAVTGITGAPTSVSLDLTGTHTWVGDMNVRLRSPDGTTFVVFGWTGATASTSAGDSSDFGGPYSFNDTATANWWTAATAAGAAVPVAAGSYRTSARGGVAGGGALTLMTPAFATIPTSNGTWQVTVTDQCPADTGSITAASLTLEGGTTPPPTGVRNVDMNGDGKTDWVVARGTDTPLTEAEGSGTAPVNRGATSIRERLAMKREEGASPELAPAIAWYININGTGATSGAVWGDAATDFLTPADFDGDGKVDIAVWREGPAGTAGFYILQSSNGAARFEQFGQTGDDPAIVGDYDGDDKADPAVYRCPAVGAGDGQCHFYYRGSLSNPGGNVTFVPWGFGETGDFFVNPGDFDGDGEYDYCIQRTAPASATQGQFVLLRSGDGGVEYINWGLNNDFILPGDYDGDGKSDFAVRRTNVTNRDHYILERDGGTQFVRFGIVGDVSAPGDYDGDGKQDIAIWRGNADASQNYFWVLNSATSSVSVFEWGQCASPATCDVPAASWYVH